MGPWYSGNTSTISLAQPATVVAPAMAPRAGASPTVMLDNGAGPGARLAILNSPMTAPMPTQGFWRFRIN